VAPGSFIKVCLTMFDHVILSYKTVEVLLLVLSVIKDVLSACAVNAAGHYSSSATQRCLPAIAALQCR
jgi:hypothetical protein